MRFLFVAAVLALALLPGPDEESFWLDSSPLDDGDHVYFAAPVASEAPDLFDRYFGPADLARVDTLRPDLELESEQLYALVTTLRARWAGFWGLRHFVEAGCGPGTPGTILYDPERRSLTPEVEQENFVRSVARAIARIESTGCHRVGLAPGSELLFGLDPESCSYDIAQGHLEDIDWTRVDVVDLQVQRLLSDACLERGGMTTYVRAVIEIGGFVREHNPAIDVLAQVSFRDNEPQVMLEALSRVAPVIDGIYFSYPVENPANPDIECGFCTTQNLELFLRSLR